MNTRRTPVAPGLVIALACTLAVFSLGLAAGCATAGGAHATRVQARLLAGQKIEMDGVIFPLAKFPARLHSAGAGPDTEVLVTIPADPDRADLNQVYSVLYGAGFRQVVMVKARRAEADTGKHAVPANSPPPVRQR